MKRLLLFFCAFTSLSASWTVTDDGGGVWSTDNTENDHTAQLTVPVDNTSAITLLWQINDIAPGSSSASLTASLPTGAWTFTDTVADDTYTFNHETNVWSNGDDSEQWTYDRTAMSWTQTAGGSAVWQYDKATGYWVYDPTGDAIWWEYHKHVDKWQADENSSWYMFDTATQSWQVTAGTGDPVPTAFPPQPLRQHQLMRAMLHIFYANRVIAPGVAAGFSVVNDGDGTWSGSNAADDMLIEYDSAATGAAMTWKNQGAHTFQQGTMAFQHNIATGGWTWQDNLNPLWARSWEFDATTNTWTDSHTTDEWVYTPTTKTWTKDTESWQYDDDAGRWTHVPTGGVWEYDASNGYWTFDPDGAEPLTYQHNSATDSWPELTDSDMGVDPFPPYVITQKMVIDDVYSKFRVAAAFIESGPFGWQAVTKVDEVWSANNASGKETLTYTPANVGTEVAWSASSTNQSFSYNIDTGAWSWDNNFDSDDAYEWTYDSTTKRWALTGSDDYWQYDVDARTWQDKDETVTWQYMPATGTWKNIVTEIEWLFSTANNTWTNQTDSSVWRYANASRLFTVVENTPDSLPSDDTLPPEALIQHVLIEYALDHLTQASAFSTGGLFGITLTAQGEGVWSGDTAAGDERLIYNATRVPYPIHSRNIGAVVAQQDTLTWEFDIEGDWKVTHAVNSGVPESSSFSMSTNLWTAPDGTTPWQWESANARWLETATERTWTFNQTTKQWTDSVSSKAWSYGATTGLWTNVTDSTAWQYDAMAQSWTQNAGDTATAENMPPRPVIERTIWSDVFAMVARSGVFVAVTPLDVTLVDQGDDSWQWHRDGANETLTFDATQDGTDRLQWTTTNNVRTWKFNPANGDWLWSTATTESGTVSWSYDGTTKKWKDGDGTALWQLDDPLTWREIANSANAWEYDPIAQQWKNSATGNLWGYFSHVAEDENDDDYVWTNITLSTAWRFDEADQLWLQTAGLPDITTDLPPEPVRQMTLIHVAWQAALASNVFVPDGAFGWQSVTRQASGIWQGTNDASDQTVTFDARIADYSVHTAQTGFESWAQELMKWQQDPTGPWRFRNILDPFVSQIWGYDPVAQDWGRATYTDSARWAYDDQALTWTHETAGYVWQYTASTSTWQDVDNEVDWTYSTATGLWTQGSTTWRYSHMSGAWAQVSGDAATLNMPPRVVVDDEVVRSMVVALRDADAFTEKAQLTWQAGEHDWHATSTLNNGQAQYDARKDHQLTWRDTHTQNTMQYNMTTKEWLWRADDQHWWYNATVGLWGRDTRALTDSWLYSSTGASWTNTADSAQVWVQGDDANTWTHQSSSTQWVYDSANNDWTQGSTRWLYSFAAGAWIELSDMRSTLANYPPLPLVQERFVATLVDGTTSFFDNPLYAAAQAAVPTQHPLFGTRPLTKNAKFDRYATSSVLVNADITMDYVTWVHNDVSRNHGKLQLPSVSTTALPAIIGGERASLLGSQFGPRIVLKNSKVACHESLVSAGVRWNVHEHELPSSDASAADAHNNSSIVCYNRGRTYDMAQRRGLVFQLGSAANRMADGSIDATLFDIGGGVLSTSSMRDGFIDIYRYAPTTGATSDAPTTIDLSLTTAQESGVSATQRAMQMLYMAHRSRVTVGWPTPTADTGYWPWNVTTAAIEALETTDAATLFSPWQTGGGSLSIAGHNWYLGGRDGDNTPPQYPITAVDQDNVVYLEYGGQLTASGAYDMLLDTVVARRLAATDMQSGRMSIPADQIMYGPDGYVQPYGIDFTTMAHTSGPLTGHVPLKPSGSEITIGAQLQADGVTQVK